MNCFRNVKKNINIYRYQLLTDESVTFLPFYEGFSNSDYQIGAIKILKQKQILFAEYTCTFSIHWIILLLKRT